MQGNNSNKPEIVSAILDLIEKGHKKI